MRERKRAASRAATVDAALRLFVERGYDAVTVGDICTAADIAPRTFFRYFATKDDVLAEPAREMVTQLEDSFAGTSPDVPDTEALRAAFRALGAYVLDHAERYLLFLRAARTAPGPLTSPLLALSSRERELAIDVAARRGAAEPPDWRTRLVVALAVAGFRTWLDDLLVGVAEPLAHLDEVLDAALGPRPGG